MITAMIIWQKGRKSQMKSIRIIRLVLENFKCHRYLELDLRGRNAAIYGDNAADVAEVRHGHWEFPVSHRTAGEGEGAFSRGVNTGLDIARSAMRNPDAIPTLPHPSGWVSVNERLPSEEIDVLLLVRETEYYGKHGEKRHVYRWVFSGWNIDGEWATTYCHGHKKLSNQAEEDPKIEYKVTHWMPLPDPPEEVTNN